MKRLIVVVLVILVIGIGFYYGYQIAKKPNYMVSKVKNTPTNEKPVIAQDEGNLIIEPGVGVGNLKFGMTQNEVTQILGEPDRVQGFTLEYLTQGMAIMGSRTTGVSVILFGDMNNPNSPLVQACKYKTKKGIGMGSSLEDLKKAYGNPSSIRTIYKGQIFSYKRIKGIFINRWQSCPYAI